MSGLSRLPVWTPVRTGGSLVYEAADSAGRAWRMWFVDEPAPADPHPPGWRYAPVENLGQAGFIEHLGGGREHDIAAARIDPSGVTTDPAFRYRVGLDDDEP